MARASQSASGEWSVEFLLSEQDVRCLAADPLNSRVIYAGTQGQGVLRSEDGGKTWRSVGLAGHIVKALAASRTQPGTVYAGTKPALLFVSRDGGASWMELASFRRIRSRWFWFSPAEKPFSAYVQAIALSPANPKVILVGIEAGAVVQSLDGGARAFPSAGMLVRPGRSRGRVLTGTTGGLLLLTRTIQKCGMLPWLPAH